MKRPRSPEVERMYRELQRVTQALPEARRNQLTRELTMTEKKKEGRITRALKAAIKGSDKTPAALAWEAGLNPSQVYRFLEGGTLTLESVDALAELLGADLMWDANLTWKSAATKSVKKPARGR